MVTDNKVIGNFRLDGIKPAPRGVPQIEVTFDIDRNGILHVSAKDKDTGKEQKIKIEDSSGLSDEEIEKAKREAEEYAEADKQRIEGIEVRNMADSTVYNLKKQMDDLGEQLPEEAKAKINEQIANVEEALKGDDTEAIKSATDELHKTFSEMASAAQAAGGPVPDVDVEQPDADGGSSEPKAAKGKVVDAEFEDVKDD